MDSRLARQTSGPAWLERARCGAYHDVLGFLRSCPSPDQSTQTWRWEHHSEGWVCGPARGTLRTYGAAAAWGGGAIMPPSQHACRASTCTAERRDISPTRSAWSAVQVHRGALRVARQTLRWRAVQRESRGTVTSCLQEAESISRWLRPATWAPTRRCIRTVQSARAQTLTFYRTSPVTSLNRLFA